MRNFLIATTLVFFSITILSSCKKAYVCQCSDQIINPYSHKLSKSEAKSEKTKCEANAGCSFKRDK